ncbi:MAG: CoA transferase [Pseudomonadales bacterium]|nr:CoA transferase [Pseudomonadales bacterium]
MAAVDRPTRDALAGLRILDLGSGPAVGLATMILADFGAEVLLAERPGGDPFVALPAAPLWRRGKHTTELDLATEAGRQRLHALAAGADVLVCSGRPSSLARRGLDYGSLARRHPHLVVAHVTGFGDTGPLAELPGYEHVVAARAGRMRLFSGLVERDGPVFSALQVGIHACAQSTVAGILAALHARAADGHGRHVRTSILQGLLAYEQGPMLGHQFRQRFPDQFPAPPAPAREPPLPSLYYHPAQAGDGRWLQFGNLLPHLFDNFLRVTDLLEVLVEPTFEPAQMLLTDPDRHEAFRARMLARIQERPAADWMADFVADGGIVAGPYQTTREALADPDIVANGHVIARDDGGVQLGPLARMSATPARPGPDAKPDAGRLESRWSTDPRAAPAAPRQSRLPLAGVRVVEIATIIAAPMAASCLADMGADVIKVEQIGGDPYRSLLAGVGSARVNAGKRSISVDLKSPEGRDIVLDLLRDADVLIHNYRPGVPERLGIGYAEIAALNPRIVYLQANGYGPDGPGALRPSTHPIPGAAMGGVLFQLGERVPREVLPIEAVRSWTRRLMCANEVNPDPNTAVVIASAVLLGLAARRGTGTGQRVIVDMFGANAYANHDDFLDYPGKPPRALADAGLHGLSATYRLYPCAGGQWVFLALATGRERQRFVDTLVAHGCDAPPAELLATGGVAAEAALAALFAARTAQEWEDLLGGAGIGCVRADGPPPAEFWLTDPQPRALGLGQVVAHPRWGAYRRHGRLVQFDDGTQPVAPPPLAGQHNAEVLGERGFDPGRIAELHAAGVLWADPALAVRTS